MDEEVLARIERDDRYRTLIRRRSRLGWFLSGLILLAYFGFTALIAFDKALLAAPIAGGYTSVGIPLGFGLIVFAILLTAFYVWRANGEFDRLTRAVIDDASA